MLIPVASYALGLGNITMNSALNQPLNAEIELLSLQPDDLNNLVVKLASEEDFQRVGAERAFFLTDIRFDVVKRKNGTAYVQLNSTRTVTEPFLDFVVEARWPRGRILREFTVLVDPPVLSAEAPAPVSQPAAAATPSAAAASRPAQTRQAPIRARAELAPVSRKAGELTYGPVKYNDTLFEIANQMRPGDVTVNQMMAALVRENPNAFYNGNVNQLKAGYVLRVDDAARLNALTVADADAEIQRQHVEWRARKSGKLVLQAEAPAGGRVARDGEGAAGSTLSAADQARLKLVAPGSQGAGSGAGEGDVNQLREDLLLAAEALDANRQETDELKSRLSQMEEQLEAMQRLIMLKDDEMLSMQKQLGKDVVPAEAETPIVSPEAISDEAAADDAAIAAMAESMPSEDEAPVVEAEEAVAPKMAPAPAVVDEPGLLDDPMLMYGGIGILVLIIAVVIQRRRRMQDGFEESILNVGGAGASAGATAETMTQGGESSMVSDFAMSEMSGMSGIEADSADVDPISEADVYLAYGRHQQAEDILKEALEKEPERNEIKLKLLEVSFAAKDRAVFEQRAQEFHDALGDESDPMWAKVVTMGSQLCPGSDLFGGSSADALKEDLAEAAEAGDDDLLDFDFDLDTDSVGGDSSGLDLEADDVFAELEAATGDAAASLAEPETEELADLNFDMEMPSEEPVKAEKPAAAPKADDDNGLDFDVSSLDFNLDVDAESEDTAVATADEEGGLDFDLGGMDELSLESAGEDLSAEDLGDELANELGDELGDELEDVFGSVDEVGTKLDLAKAYVDMGDADGARSILDEVLEEGDDEQKKQAEELLSQIA
ncbi:MAG: FimV/HubP family polar landmark protein [Gammaproteobacteria bacterium]|nr:FimV/HubP family polar landmark protein [Gammaproteobacteria bacterium]